MCVGSTKHQGEGVRNELNWGPVSEEERLLALPGLLSGSMGTQTMALCPHPHCLLPKARAGGGE